MYLAVKPLTVSIAILFFFFSLSVLCKYVETIYIGIPAVLGPLLEIWILKILKKVNKKGILLNTLWSEFLA